MTLATEVQKIKDSKAFYAVAGAGDLAWEKLQEVPTRLQEVPARLRDLQAKADARDIPNVARSYATQAGAKATELFDELAERGKTVVGKPESEHAAEITATPAEAERIAKAE